MIREERACMIRWKKMTFFKGVFGGRTDGVIWESIPQMSNTSRREGW